jgi:hypothetical protein
MSLSSNGNHPAGVSRAPGNAESCNRLSASGIGVANRGRRPPLLSTNSGTPARRGSDRVLRLRHGHNQLPNRRLGPRRKYRGAVPLPSIGSTILRSSGEPIELPVSGSAIRRLAKGRLRVVLIENSADLGKSVLPDYSPRPEANHRRRHQWIANTRPHGSRIAARDCCS